jgi:DNA-binding CsgD family transcriptional regulator
VEEHTSVIERDRILAPSNPTDRFHHLLSSFWALHTNNRALMAQLRGSLGQLRELRGRLRQRPVSAIPNLNGREPEDRLIKKFGLTRREVQVARLLAQGRSNQWIAGELRISEHTARHHTQRILAKLEVHSRGEAAAKIRG